MVAVGNLNGVEERLDFFYNDNGVIRGIDDFDVFVKNGIKFPQKQNCLLNLTQSTWLLNTLDKASSFITAPIVEVKTNNTNRSDFGSITQSTPSGNSLQVKKGEYWYLPNYGSNRITLSENVLTTGNFTLAITTRFVNNPSTSWRDLLLFQNTDQFRLEWTGSTFVPYANNNVLASSPSLPQITRTDWFQIVVVVDNLNLKIYQNGVLEVNTTLRRAINVTDGDILSFYTQRGSGGVAGFGTSTHIRDLQVWKTALTEQEVSDLREWLYLV